MKKTILILICYLFAVSRGGFFAAEAAKPAMKTTIESDSLEMKGGTDRNHFYFTKHVSLLGNNMLITCEKLEVETLRGGDQDATVGKIGSIVSAVATDNVVITQSGRKATCGRADFNPKEGLVVLSDNPKVLDTEAEVTGWKIVIHTGDRKVQVLSDPDAPDKKAQVTLASLPDFGFDKQKADKTPPKEDTAAAAPVSQP